jgi:carbonic anhydrase
MDPIDKLTAGFKVFRDGRFKEQRATYEALVDQGQSPKVALVACSDSRVDPGIVLQADPGDLFIIRNVANLVPPCERGGRFHGTSTAVEFAVDHLEVGHIIVLGHAHCGGIRSLFDSPGESGRDDSFVPSWMGLVRSAYLRVEGTMPEAPLEDKARICEQSAVMVADGRLRLHGWHIDIRSCALQVYDPASQHFEAVG